MVVVLEEMALMVALDLTDPADQLEMEMNRNHLINQQLMDTMAENTHQVFD